MLQTSRWILRILNWLNWGLGVSATVALIAVGFAAPDAFLAAVNHGGVTDAHTLLNWLRWGGALTVPIMLLAHIIFTRLIAIIDSVAGGNAFSMANALRLRTIAWALLGTQVIDLLFGVISARASAASGEYLGWSPGVTGWVAVLLLFVLAKIFESGAAMQDDLEGTI